MFIAGAPVGATHLKMSSVPSPAFSAAAFLASKIVV